MVSQDPFLWISAGHGIGGPHRTGQPASQVLLHPSDLLPLSPEFSDELKRSLFASRTGGQLAHRRPRQIPSPPHPVTDRFDAQQVRVRAPQGFPLFNRLRRSPRIARLQVQAGQLAVETRVDLAPALALGHLIGNQRLAVIPRVHGIGIREVDEGSVE